MITQAVYMPAFAYVCETEPHEPLGPLAGEVGCIITFVAAVPSPMWYVPTALPVAVSPQSMAKPTKYFAPSAGIPPQTQVPEALTVSGPVGMTMIEFELPVCAVAVPTAITAKVIATPGIPSRRNKRRLPRSDTSSSFSTRWMRVASALSESTLLIYPGAGHVFGHLYRRTVWTVQRAGRHYPEGWVSAGIGVDHQLWNSSVNISCCA